MENLNYYEAGKQAYLQGRAIADNEYSPGSVAWEEWRSGWFNQRALSEFKETV